MIPIFSIPPFVRKAIGLMSGLVVATAAGAVDLQTLLDRSPFAPPGQAAVGATAAEQGTLEFRGVVTDDGGTAYSIFDASTNKGRWVRAGDESSPIKVRGYDAANGLLEVEQNGRPVQLSLKRATIQAGQPVAVMAKVATPGGSSLGSSRVRRQAPADARQLEAVAERVRRLRASRVAAKSASQGQAPGTLAPAPTVPVP